RASTVIAASDYLRRELETKVSEARGKTEVVDSGVDLDRFSVLPRADGHDRPSFVCVGSLTERKNVVRLADAFARLGRGSLTFVGEGPLRPQLEGRARVRLAGRRPHAEGARHLARLLVARAHLRRVDPLLQPVVPRHQQLLDLRARTLVHRHVRYSPVRVLIADDEPLFAEALEVLLAADERIDVVGRATDGS